MSRAVRRRQKRRSDAVNRAIDEAIEKLYVATGLNTSGKRGGRVKKRGRERDADVLVAIGNPTFGNVRGRAPAAPKALVTTLAKRYRTFTLSERNTSKLCDECGSELVKTRGHSVRYWRCPCAGGGMIDGRDGKRRHEKEQNKDIIASRSILIILLTLLTTGIRPKAWSDDDDDATKRDDDDAADTMFARMLGSARHAQVQAAKRPGGSLDVLVTDHLEAIRGVLLAGGDLQHRQPGVVGIDLPLRRPQRVERDGANGGL